MSPDPVLLTRGKVTAQSMGTGTTFDMPGNQGMPNKIDCSGDDELVINGDLTGAAAGDLTVAVQPYEADGVTVQPVSLPPMYTPPANTVQGGHVYLTSKYDVTGYDAVRVRFTNANAGTQTLTASWRLS